MLPKVRRSAQGCSTCKTVLQTKKSAQKVLSAIGKGLYDGAYFRPLPHSPARPSLVRPIFFNLVPRLGFLSRTNIIQEGCYARQETTARTLMTLSMYSDNVQPSANQSTFCQLDIVELEFVSCKSCF